MIILKKYQEIQKVCKGFMADKNSFSDIIFELKHKAHKTVFYKGLYSELKDKNPYLNEKWGVFFFQLWNAGRFVQEKYKLKYEPKINF